MNLILTVIVAVIGSVVFYKMKIPAGALIGAIIFSAVFNIVTDLGAFPIGMKTVVQAIAGGFIGQRVTRQDVSELRKTFVGGLLVLGMMIAYTLGMGTLLAAISPMDLATAYVAVMPAGLSDSAIICADLGADPTQTTVMQLVRTLFSIVILPQVVYRFCAHYDKRAGIKKPEFTKAVGIKTPAVRTKRNFTITFLLAEGFGLLGMLSGIPAGALTFAILSVASLNVRTGKAFLPNWLKLVAQCMTGIIVGIKVTMQDIQNIPYLIVPVLLTLASLLILNFLSGFLLHKISKLDIATSLFGTIPAGISDMALISADLGGNAPKVGMLQLVRFVGILSIMPSIIKMIT